MNRFIDVVKDLFDQQTQTTKPEEDFGKDFSEKEIYKNAKKEPYIGNIKYDKEFNKFGIAFSAPVKSEGEFLGVVVIKIEMGELPKLIERNEGFNNIGQIYLIGEERLLLTPSRYFNDSKNQGVFTQEFKTKSAYDCFDENLKGHDERNEPVYEYLDYRGKQVFGTHLETLKTPWCVLIEIDKQKALDEPLQKLMQELTIKYFFIIFLTTTIGYFMRRFFDKK